MKVYLARMEELITEKKAEPPKGHVDRKFKGRCVLLGSMVNDEKFEAAVYVDAALAPAALEAARALDAYSCLGDHAASQSDATSAYTQCFLKGTPKWTPIPKERWPGEWRGKFLNPVVRLYFPLGLRKSLTTGRLTGSRRTEC